MKTKGIFAFLICIILAFSFFSCESGERGDYVTDAAVTTVATTAKTTAATVAAGGKLSLGNPLFSYYKDNINARNPWDMAFYNGKLYIGGGDYGANVTAMSIFAYNGEEWESTHQTNDHAISRFREIDGALYVAGADSLGSWESGNYYILDDYGWRTFEIPDAVHAYDIIKCDEGLLFGIGTGDKDTSPAKLMDKLGNWVSLPLYKNGKSIIGNGAYSYFRIYNFFETGEGIFAFGTEADQDSYTRVIYKYEGNRLEYVCSLESIGIRFYIRKNSRLWQDFFGTTVTRGEYCYLTSGYLYKTRDFSDVTEISAPHNAVITDLLYKDGALYALGFTEQSSSTFSGYIWQIGEDDSFSLVREFETKGGYALSLEYDGEDFFVGIGNTEIAWSVGYVYRLPPSGVQ